jgi:hypothetical protein
MRGSGMQGKVAKVRETGVKGMAWLSFALAVIGGAALTATFLSDWTVALFQALPDGWTHTAALVALGVGVAMLVRDLWMDSTPNHPALYVAIALPTVARAVSGKLSAKVTELSHDVMDKVVGGGLGEWAGTTAALGIAAFTIAVSIVLAQRVVNPSHGGR